MSSSAASDLGIHCLQRPICPNTQGYLGNFYYFIHPKITDIFLFLHESIFCGTQKPLCEVPLTLKMPRKPASENVVC